MYRKATTGELFITTYAVYMAEYSVRRKDDTSICIGRILRRKQHGFELDVTDYLYLDRRLALRHTKKGYYSRCIKDYR